MVLPIEQIATSLNRLMDLHNFFGMSFLAFKRAEIPEGSTIPGCTHLNACILCPGVLI